jgi:uncharacterized protein with von Willebrand factor type A (vWA) domain
MDLTLARFVTALRKADVRVSPAETLDAFEVTQRLGVADAATLRNGLRLVLAKTVADKARFDSCFERFFHQLGFRAPVKQSFFRGIDRETLLHDLKPRVSGELHEVLDEVMHDDRSHLAFRLEQVASALHLERMHALRDRTAYAEQIARVLGADELEALLRDEGAALPSETAHALRYVRMYLREQVHAYVDTQYRLRVDASGRKGILEAAFQSSLANLPPDFHADMRAQVERIAARLSKDHRRRRKVARRGVLDLKRTLRANIAYDETLFNLHWRRQARERATVFALCDVSGSVSRIARFLLLLLYNLADVLPQVRSFAFSSRLGEVTRLFEGKALEVAVEEALFDWGKGNTDYARAFTDFRELALADVNHRSTVIILGDARNNHYDPKPERLKEIAARAKQVLWLNPEPEEQWGDGDSEMLRYAPHCFRVTRLASLKDLERFADTLLAAHR